ncbi:MAG TPA: 3-phosphoserine/phosphohydroxythreonine transaminase [Steroidobacteraceae bacterium]|jgi:phosphoserine aminotransferase|nr:3-phosphoserine/phosphohydroxythreonine transaminase [Steroidobacteraceae bacterium]
MRAFNFAAGPAMLPLEVLEQVRSELTDWQGSGSSVMEISHRSKAFSEVAATAERDLRELLGIPDDYRVLFMQGGARAQFACIPLNLASPAASVDYLITGVWSKLALAEAQRYCRVNVAADEAPSSYCTVPEPRALQLQAGAAYVHYTPNETIGGVEFPYTPDTGGTPLVADMSSTLLSRPIEVARCALIYASAQKNIGPAGLTVVIVRDELLGRARAGTPAVWDYRALAEQGSMLNTPPTFAWYVAGLVFKWLKAHGGLAAMQERNRAKAALLYAAIDASGFYRNPVAHHCRSWMNVPFTLAQPALDAQFLRAAAAAGLCNLEGHRSVGGMRASLYNAMPLAAVAALTAFMQDFERRHG